MRPIVCPYCFVRTPPRRIAFRCAGRAGRGPGCDPELDERLAEYTGSTAGASLPPVFHARSRAARRWLSGGILGGPDAGPRQADCPRCGRATGRRVCPECHNPLPAAYCDTPSRIVALVGAKNAGKSTYIAVLLHELMNRLGTELDTSLVACDDRTIDRYKRDFARPLFDERRLLPTTTSAAAVPREPLVYLLTRTRQGRRWRGVARGPKHQGWRGVARGTKHRGWRGVARGTKHRGWRGVARGAKHGGGARNDALTLVLFDTAGEDLRSREIRDLHLRYLEAADAIIFLVDPLELPGARSALRDHEGAPPEPVTAGDPDSEPINVIARVTEALRQRHGATSSGRGGAAPGDPLPVPVAVALTKVDALRPAVARQSPLHRARDGHGVLDLDDRDAVDAQVRSMLHEWQAGQLDLYLRQQYAEYGLFGVSALGGLPHDGLVGAGGVRPYRVEDPLLWLLHRFGMLDGVRPRGEPLAGGAAPVGHPAGKPR